LWSITHNSYRIITFRSSFVYLKPRANDPLKRGAQEDNIKYYNVLDVCPFYDAKG